VCCKLHARVVYYIVLSKENSQVRIFITSYDCVSRSAGCFGCYVTCPNAVSSRVIHLVFHRHQHNYSSSLDSIKLVY
jgi:hypothetical protein